MRQRLGERGSEAREEGGIEACPMLAVCSGVHWSSIYEQWGLSIRSCHAARHACRRLYGTGRVACWLHCNRRSTSYLFCKHFQEGPNTRKDVAFPHLVRHPHTAASPPRIPHCAAASPVSSLFSASASASAPAPAEGLAFFFLPPVPPAPPPRFLPLAVAGAPLPPSSAPLPPAAPFAAAPAPALDFFSCFLFSAAIWFRILRSA